MPDDASRGPALRFASYALDVDGFELRGPQGTVQVEPRVFELLRYLIENRRRVVTKEELFDTVWQGREVSDAALSRAIHQARKAIDDDARRQDRIATVHGRGYRFVADVAVEPVPGRPGPPATKTDRKPGKHSWRLPTLLLVLLASGATLAWKLRPPAPVPPARRVVRIAVVPPGADRELTSIALCEGIATYLTTLPGVVVRPCGISSALVTEVGSLGELGRRLGADAVVHGSIAGSPPALRLSLLRVPAGGDRSLSTFAMPADVADSAVSLAAVAARGAAAIGQDLVGRRPIESRHLAASDMAAYGLYLRGAWARHTRCSDTGRLEMLARVTSLDAGFAPGWLMLAEEHLRLAGPCGFHPSHFTGALSALEQAAGLGAPRPLTAALKARAEIGLGRLSDAYETLRSAELRQADPRLDWTAAVLLVHAGALEEARWRRRRALRQDPDHARFAADGPLLRLALGPGEGPAAAADPDGELGLGAGELPAGPAGCVANGLAALRRGRPEEAMAALRPAFRFDPADHYARLAEALLAVLEGSEGEGRRILDQLVRTRRGAGAGEPSIDFRIAQAFVVAGAHGPALAALHRAVERGFLCAACAAADPLWASLRDHPAFDDALGRARARGAELDRRLRIGRSNRSP